MPAGILGQTCRTDRVPQNQAGGENMGAMTEAGLKARKLVAEFISTCPTECFYLKELSLTYPGQDAKLISNHARAFIKQKKLARISRGYYKILNFVPPKGAVNNASMGDVKFSEAKPETVEETEYSAYDIADRFVDGWHFMKSDIESLKLKLKAREHDNHNLSVELNNAKAKMAQMNDAIVEMKHSKTIKL